MKKVVTALAAAVTLSTVATGNAFAAEKYDVKKGDTLWDISHKYSTTVHHLKDWNDLSSDLILPNQTIIVSSKDNNESHSYTVKDHDTLWDIAKAYGVTAEQLKKWNKLQSETIHKGDSLKIYSTASKVDDRDAAHTNAQVTSASISDKDRADTAAPAPEKKAKPASKAEGKEVTVKATAYTADCEGCSGVTATGINVKNNPGKKVIAVDPKVIPLGSKVYVEGYGYAVAGDTGGAIKGNHIDVLVSNHDKAVNWGVKHNVKVTIVD